MQKLMNFQNVVSHDESPIKDNLLKIEISSICNCRCSWCWMQSYNKIKQGFMDINSFKTVIDLNENFFKKGALGKWKIEPFFNGESLVNPQFFEMIEYAISKDIELGDHFDTNLSVEIDINRFMAIPWRSIYVNIGGITKEVHTKNMKGSDFDLVLKNIKKMLKINKDIVYIKMNPTKSNLDQINMLGEFFEQLGGNPENIIESKLGFTLPHAASDIEREEFFNDLITKDGNFDYLRFTYDLSKEGYNIKAKKKGCNCLLPCVAFDGRVTPCCHDQLGLINVGNAFKEPLEDIFNSTYYLETIKKCLRHEYFFCKECN